jgi:uncharacterized membrane protein required for colicin V production
MIYWIVFLIVLFAGTAMTVREGVWSNTITLVNIIISGLVAFGFYSPLVVYLDEEVTSGQHTYWLDFAIIWALFCVTMIICRALTGVMSKTKLRFKNPIDPVAGPIVGFIAAWVLATFVMATLHVSPMPKDAFSGNLSYTNGDTASMITQPDAAWLKFVESMTSPDAFGAAANNQIKAGSFVKIYTARREKFDKSPSFIVKRGT